MDPRVTKDFSALANALIVSHLNRASHSSHVPLGRTNRFERELMVYQLCVNLNGARSQYEKVVQDRALLRDDVTSREVVVFQQW